MKMCMSVCVYVCVCVGVNKVKNDSFQGSLFFINFISYLQNVIFPGHFFFLHSVCNLLFWSVNYFSTGLWS